jgi:hypothetical protein
MRLGERHAYLTRTLPDGRIIDVRPWRSGVVQLVVQASAAPWAYAAFYWYAALPAALCAALAWDGDGTPPGAGPCPRLG